MNQVYSLEVQKCLDCPPQTPIFNGESCVACPANQLYNAQTKICQACQGGQVLNNSTKVCECPSGRFWTGVACI